MEDVIFPIVWGCGSVECRTLSIMKHGTDEEWLLNDIHIIKPLVWLELIMISSIDLCGDTKLSKASSKEAE